MIPALLWVSLFLKRDPGLIEQVWMTAARIGLNPILAVATVEYESNFNPKAKHHNIDSYDYMDKKGKMHTKVVSESWDRGLWQINDKHHPDKRLQTDLGYHILYGAAYLRKCIIDAGGRIQAGLSAYNTGKGKGEVGERYARHVLKVYYRLLAAIDSYERHRTPGPLDKVISGGRPQESGRSFSSGAGRDTILHSVPPAPFREAPRVRAESGEAWVRPLQRFKREGPNRC